MTTFESFRVWFQISSIVALFLCGKGNAAETNHGLSADSKGGVLLNGKPFRGIGVNYYDAFARLLDDGKVSEVEAGFRVLASNQIPFIRFSACGYWPVNWGLYQTNRGEYFARFDKVVKLAEAHDIGLIPSLFWHQPTISDLVGEPVNQWGNSSSKTLEFMRAYTREVVTRYRNSPAIWAWEFGNEFNLPADLPNAAQHRAPIVPQLGTPTTRSNDDDLSHKDIRVALQEFAREVRRHDPHRLILSGNAFPRPSAWHQQHEGTWKSDSLDQRMEMLLADNPSPVSSLSGRLYSTNDLVLLKPAMQRAKRIGKPLIIGEFGVEGPMTDATRKQFQDWLDALKAYEVPLAALWVFDFANQKGWSVTAENDRKEQLSLIGRMNVPSRPLKMDWIKISADQKSFVSAPSGRRFTPLGFNYDRDYKMRLLEDYWDAEWATVVEDFREMKELGANVVRIHLQFAKFMNSENEPNAKSLAQLERLIRLAEETGLYLDLTGLACYRKADVPTWFDALSEKERWSAQANFWEAIARTCAKSPAIFCYDLINEPVVPGKKINDWLVGELAGFYYVQAIALDPANRTRAEIAREWISKLTAAIRRHDKKHLITVGLLPMEGSQFVREVSQDLDFISVHIYPRTGELTKDLETLKKFAIGKPVVVEEIFPMHCKASELREFIEQSRPTASGWIGFYWGQTADELRNGTKISDAFTREWLNVFQQIQTDIKAAN